MNEARLPLWCRAFLLGGMVKTLAEREMLDELEARVRSLSVDDRRRWGSMDVAQMVRHLEVAFPHWGQAEYVVGPEAAVRKARALGEGANWPMIVRDDARAEVAGDAAELEAAKARLLTEMKRFVAEAGERQGHPAFGAMTPSDWLRLGYLHTDHHLRQFGR